jgi:hypothetical protein
MRLMDFLLSPDKPVPHATPETDALRQPDALQEAQLLDIRFEIAANTAWLLLDCRGALQIEEGNTAVVAVSAVRDLRWNAAGRAGWFSYTVMSSSPRWTDTLWSLDCEMLGDATLAVTAERAQFWIGNVAGCDDAPPDYVDDDDATIRAGLASWQSEFEPVYATSFN